MSKTNLNKYSFIIIILLSVACLLPSEIKAQEEVVTQVITTEARATVPNPKKKISEKREEAKVRFEKKQAEMEERRSIKKEEIKEKLTEIQIKRLENMKEQTAHVEERFDKIAEFLYAKLERISKHVEEREQEGFDLDEFKKNVDSIKDKIAATEAKVSKISDLYEGIESLTVDQMKAKFEETKALIKEIKADYSSIRNDMVNLIKGIEA
jgi:chromosome segregation ATPase